MAMKSKRSRQDEAITNTKDYVDPARGRLEKKPTKRFASKYLTEQRRKRALRAKTKTPFTPEEDESLNERIHLEGTTVPRHERLGIMFIAVANGVTAAAKQFDISTRLIYGWFREEGGFTEIAGYVEAAAKVGFNKVTVLLYEEIQIRMKDASDEELFESYRKLMPIQQGDGLTNRQRRERGESDGSPVPPQGGVHLHFNTPSLPEGESKEPPKDVDTKSPPPGEDIVEGEAKVIDVFD